MPIGCVTYDGGHEIQFEFIWKGFIESNKGRQLQIRIFREDDQYGDPVYTQTIGEAQRKTDGSNLWTYPVPVGISENAYGFYQKNPQTNDYMWDIVYISASGFPIESSGYEKGCFHYIPNNSPLAPNKVDSDN